MPMIHRTFPTFIALAAGLFLSSLPTFAQATNAPTAAPAAVAPAPVAPAAAPEAAPAASNEPRPATYTLQGGDTLESVGKQWDLTGRQLQKYNHLTNHQVRRLQIGQVIKIPPASK
jgi:LysM repeat protein